MSLTVGVDTYISLADARTYVAVQGLTPLPILDADAEALLKRATIALDRNYGNRYLGIKVSETQTLAWPRNYINSVVNIPHFEGEWPYVVVDSDGNPRDFSGLQPETGYAETEMAVMLQANVDLYAQPDPYLSQIRQKVSSLEEEKQFKGNQGYRVDPLYKITLILRPLLKTSTGSIPITRGA